MLPGFLPRARWLSSWESRDLRSTSHSRNFTLKVICAPRPNPEPLPHILCRKHFSSPSKLATARSVVVDPKYVRRQSDRLALPIGLLSFGISASGNQFDLGRTAAGPGISLVPSIPAVDEFPMAVWERLRAQVLARKGTHLLRYASHLGDPDLRKAIAAYLCDFRAVRCDPEQIVIAAGMQQAMLITAMAVINPGEIAWVEDPGYLQARRAFILAGAEVVPKPLDNEGLMITRARREPLPKLIYIAPSHQFPLGITMSFPRGKPCSISPAITTL